VHDDTQKLATLCSFQRDLNRAAALSKQVQPGDSHENILDFAPVREAEEKYNDGKNYLRQTRN
jgi:hypothetical protein